ncbi:DoxX family protein [Flavobacterium sp.]|uniref:DoxX family protein n=1 Tax=Flavobacterium sp. TaxID=239 RepID=UPI00286A4D3A|nr:DoxX family protein [Flavobacterium sp.]
MKKLALNSFQPINLDLGLLFIRIIIGLLMAFYGYEKLIHFETMAASDFWTKNVNFLGFTGKIPLALTVFAELFCSILLIIGLLSRLALIPLLICMGFIIVAIMQFSVLNSGDNGYEINTAFVYFIIYLALFFTGPGKYSLDSRFLKS